MKKRITLNTFRKVTALEETMARAMMPRTSEADATPLAPHYAQERSTVVGTVAGTRLARRSVAALTYTLAEVAHV